ncbi:hypothetical protein C0J45_13331 [Silurus meridionalis]|nr:hypothetical protein C0J45_13331 [Silurus meridionalis]
MGVATVGAGESECRIAKTERLVPIVGGVLHDGAGFVPEVSRDQSPCHFGYGRFVWSETDSSGGAGKGKERHIHRETAGPKLEKAFKQ